MLPRCTTCEYKLPYAGQFWMCIPHKRIVWNPAGAGCGAHSLLEDIKEVSLMAEEGKVYQIYKCQLCDQIIRFFEGKTVSSIDEEMAEHARHHRVTTLKGYTSLFELVPGGEEVVTDDESNQRIQGTE